LTAAPPSQPYVHPDQRDARPDHGLRRQRLAEDRHRTERDGGGDEVGRALTWTVQTFRSGTNIAGPQAPGCFSSRRSEIELMQ
jgi:hypothetical protein